jgi:predicted DNA-binding transcriptional regulator YafY
MTPGAVPCHDSPGALDAMSRTERLFAVTQYLQTNNGRTLADFAARMGVSERTVFRDLASLQESGVPIVCDAGRYRIKGAKSGGLSLDSGELALVRVALKSTAVARKNGPLSRTLTRIISKLDQVLGKKR